MTTTTTTNRQLKRIQRQHEKALRAWHRRRQNGRKYEPMPRDPLRPPPATTREAFEKPDASRIHRLLVSLLPFRI